MDSGASDTMFVSRDAFAQYKPVTPRTGDSAKADDGSFEIVGEGNVVQRYQVDGKEREITYTRALHTPTTTFGNGKGVIRKSDGTVVEYPDCHDILVPTYFS
jgi:hypothetical protein